MTAEPWVVQAVDPAVTHPLRRRVLRPDQTLEELVVPGEGDPLSGWYAATFGGEVVGCAGIIPESREGHVGEWRLRAMAVDPEMQGRSIGVALVARCVRHVIEANGVWVWCKARTAASGFYTRLGFSVVGDAYEIPGIGEHVTMEAPVSRLDF